MINLSADIREKISAWSIFVVVITIPLKSGLNAVAIMAAVATALLFGDRGSIVLFFKNRLGMALTAYLFMIIGYCFYDANFSLLERSLIIVAIPFVFYVNSVSIERLRNFLQIYILVFTALVVFSIVYTILLFPEDVAFSLYEFSGALATSTFFSSNYIALYVSFACIILFDSFFDVKLFKKAPALILFVLLLGYLMVLGSRTAFFASIMIMIARLMVFVVRMRSVKGMIMAVVMCLAGVLPVILVPYFHQRVVTLYTVGFHADARYYEYAAAIEVFKEAPWFGHGPKRSEEAMVREFTRIGFHEGVQRKYNAHNQYIQALIDFGVAGLAVVGAIIIVSFLAAWQGRCFLPLAFVTFFAVCALTESLFLRNRGISFYALFAGAFLVRPDIIKAYYKKKVR